MNVVRVSRFEFRECHASLDSGYGLFSRYNGQDPVNPEATRFGALSIRTCTSDTANRATAATSRSTNRTLASAPGLFARETERGKRAAMAAVMAAERALGHSPRDVSAENRGYDVESTVSAGDGGDRTRFLEVKGRIRGARTVTVSQNEILTAFNEPEGWILALFGERCPPCRPHGL
jgi:hypothetical protein